MAKTVLNWQKNMSFDVELDGHKFMLNAADGIRPKGLLLSALGGCTGMDVVSILKKMKVEDFQLEIEVTADQTDNHPIIYKDIVVNYNFSGTDLPLAKIKKAVSLSETTYCGVSAMLGKAAKIDHFIRINGEVL